MNNPCNYSEILTAVIGVVGTLAGTVLGWILNGLSQRGKLKIFVSSWKDTFEYNEHGYMVLSTSKEQVALYQFEVVLDIYNSSREAKIMRNIEIAFNNERNILKTFVPDDVATRYEIGKQVFCKKVAPINVPPQSVIQIKLRDGLWRKDGNMDFIWNTNKVYLENLYKICDEIFGTELHLGTFIWKRRQMVDSRSKTGVSEDHEYLICFARQPSKRIRGQKTDMSKYSNPDNDPRGDWMSADMTGLATASQRPNLHYDLENPATGIVYSCPPTGWRYERKRMTQLIENNEIIFPDTPNGRPRRKKFARDLQSTYSGLSTVLNTVFNTQATRELKALFDGEDYFDFPKPVEYIKMILEQGSSEDDIVLDFFSGSATTAHAVMQLNAEDGGHRKFIMVQLPEKTDEKSEAYKAGYENICEIGKERIRRAGAKIKEDNPLTTLDLDVGFRVLKCDESNMKPVYYTPAETEQGQMDLLADNIKEDRTPEDLLFQVMLDMGVELSSSIEVTEIAGKKVFDVGHNFLLACFDRNVTEETVTEVAKRKPSYFAMRDSSMADDTVAANFEQIFRTYSPETVRRVL